MRSELLRLALSLAFVLIVAITLWQIGLFH
jgi:hypothetical protein